MESSGNAQKTRECGRRSFHCELVEHRVSILVACLLLQIRNGKFVTVRAKKNRAHFEESMKLVIRHTKQI